MRYSLVKYYPNWSDLVYWSDLIWSCYCGFTLFFMVLQKTLLSPSTLSQNAIIHFVSHVLDYDLVWSEEIIIWLYLIWSDPISSDQICSDLLGSARVVVAWHLYALFLKMSPLVTGSPSSNTWVHFPMIWKSLDQIRSDYLRPDPIRGSSLIWSHVVVSPVFVLVQQQQQNPK